MNSVTHHCARPYACRGTTPEGGHPTTKVRAFPLFQPLTQSQLIKLVTQEKQTPGKSLPHTQHHKKKKTQQQLYILPEIL